jgi:peptide-methionine (S)-S-oxide reductase
MDVVKKEKAYFAAGCFWGVEAVFRQLEGVLETSVGFMGGHTQNPTYEETTTGKTGHAEIVEVVYDSTKISYEQLLETFWNAHDPTQVNRQGPDVGTQYRSAIFCVDDEQCRIAEESRKKLRDERKFVQPIATEIVKVGDYTIAEEYHQQYLEKRGLATCHPDFNL